MPEIYKKPPSNIRIRTLESDTEQMRQSGGEITTSGILGKKIEEIEEAPPVPEEETGIFEEQEISLEKTSPKKTKVLPVVIAAVVFLLLGGGITFLLVSKSKKQPPLPTASPTPSYVSLFRNFAGERLYLKFTGKIEDFEKILNQEFQKITQPNNIEEIIFMKDEINPYPADDFLKIIYAGFPTIGLTDIPEFEKNFSALIVSDQFAKNSFSYVLKINEANLSTFAVGNLKAKFSTVFERFIEEHYDLLTSQYLENPGLAQKPFLTKPIGPVNSRYLKFSTAKEFYYGFYQNYFLVGTSETAFQKTLEALLPKI